jgi:SAM-dependent methyltransferase
MFLKQLGELCQDGNPKRFVSLGSGNCDVEIGLARQLRAAGHDAFIFDCVELNSTMLERGVAAARSAGVAEHLTFVEADLNSWTPAREYDAAIANQSLHHIVNLEGLFDNARRALVPGGMFLISDVIGRNGHQRWPEALDVVHEFWRRLPPSYRFNHKSHCYEELYEDHDCSVEGFEGVRAQDILPLLLEHFQFRFFFPFGNVIDPFVDRAFGPNFDPAREWDRALIDEVHDRDEREIAAGSLRPTHLLAVAVNEQAGVSCASSSKAHSPRSASPGNSESLPDPAPVYAWRTWPHTAQEELEIACGRLAESARLIRKQTEWALSLEKESLDRLDWGLGLERDFNAAQVWALRLDRELAERTAWALQLEKEVGEKTAWALRNLEEAGRLERELFERTEWALRLERELAEKVAWSQRLQEEVEEQRRRTRDIEIELRGYLRNPLRLVARILRALVNRVMR